MFGEPLWRKLERETRMKASFPELDGTSPDEVMAIDADRTRRGAGTVSDFSQRVMQLARYAAEEARRRDEERNRTGAMPGEIDQGSRGQRPYSVPAPEKRPGVPRGVAEAFPETVQGGPVYDSGSSAPSINLTGSLLDNREGLPGPLKTALDTPVLGTVLTEAARPSNWVSAAAAPLSFAPNAGMVTRLGAEVAASSVGSMAGQYVTDKTGNSLLGFGAGLVAGQAAGAGASRAFGGLPDINAGSVARDIETAPRPRPVTAGGSPVAEILDRVVPGQKLEDAILQNYEGRVNTAALAIKRDLDRGNDLLDVGGIGRAAPNGRRVDRSPDMETLFRALHGEVPAEDVPLKLKPIYDDLIAQVADETQKSVDFDPKFMARPDYFPRGWKAPKETRPGAGRMGSTPGFKKARVDATFSDMLADGWEPRSWNPYEMLAERRLAGEQFREQTQLVTYLQDAQVAVKADGPLPNGYRIPRVGPAFEGKPKIIPGMEQSIERRRPFEYDVLTGGGIDSETLPPLPELQGRIDELKGQLSRDAEGRIRRNKANDALVDEIGRLEASAEVRGAINQANGDVFDALDRIEQINERLGNAVTARGDVGARNRLLNESNAQRRRRQRAGRQDWLTRLTSGTDPDFPILARQSAALVDFMESASFDRRVRDIIEVETKRGLPQFAGFTQRWAVPDSVADVLENMYGSPMRIAVGGKNVLPAIDFIGNVSKRSKLFGSLFQQIDFATRTGWFTFGGAFDSLTRGHPIEAVAKTLSVPAEIGKLAYANVSGARRSALRDQILSGEALFKDRPGITLKGVSQAGWRTTDITILNRGLREMIHGVDTPKGLPRAALQAATDRLGRVESAMQDGLFDGVYPQAQIISLKNNVLPGIMRAHPDWTDQQVMASAAQEINKMYSSLGNWQTVFRDRGMRALTQRLIFSTNEPEALIRQALSTVSGPNKRLWAENWIGGTLFLATVANVVHYAATGEPLPLDRYSPVKVERDGKGPMGLDFDLLPIGYNTRFMSPNLPGIEGRNGTEVALDLMGQMDTVFRVLDPNSFLTSRFSTPLRAAVNQLKGEDFYGRPLETPKERVTQLATDILMPITAGNVATIAGVGSEGEARVGKAGLALQATGTNVRAETNQMLRDRKATEYAQQQGLEGVSTLDELAGALNLTRSNAEKRLREAFPELDAELTQRRAEQAVGDPETQNRIALDDFRAQASQEQEADDARVLAGEISWDQWKDNRTRRMEQVRGFSTAVYGDQPIEKPKNAYEEWLNVVRENRTPDGVDWDAVDGWIAQQSPEKQQFIQDNTGLYGTKLEKERRAVADELDRTGYFDVSDKTWATVQKQAAFAKTVAGFDDYYGWYQAQISKLAAQMVKSGLPPGAANVEAERALRSHPIVKAYGDLKNALESQWVAKVIKTDLPDQAMRMGYFKPTKEQSEMILTYPGARTAALP